MSFSSRVNISSTSASVSRATDSFAKRSQETLVRRLLNAATIALTSDLLSLLTLDRCASCRSACQTQAVRLKPTSLLVTGVSYS